MRRTIQHGLLRTATALSMVLAVSAVSAQTTLTINSLGDDPGLDPETGTCSTGNVLGDPPPLILECTLRAAIETANEIDGPVVIEISSGIETTIGDVSVIDIASALPYISNQVTIAGDTHPEHDDDNRTHLALKGPETGSFSGLRLGSGASGSVVRGIGISKFANSGILISGGENYTIENNVLGGFWGGTAWNAPGNRGQGLDISNANGSQIRNNVIHANDANGVRIRNGSANNVLQGNVVGLRRPDITLGPFAPISGNSGHGIHIASSAGTANGIGLFEGNTISNNDGSGILIEADGQVVLGNAIGIPHDGEADTSYPPLEYGNGVNGVEITSSDNQIGTSGGGRNTIGYSQSSGIVIGDDNAIAADNNVIAWNYIGTNAEGENLGMGTQLGIGVFSGTDNLLRNNLVSNNFEGIGTLSEGVLFMRGNTITHNAGSGVTFLGPGQLGSLDPNDANIIGHNSVGVMVNGYANSTALVAIRNNLIGTDADGTPMGNDVGIVVGSEFNRVWIGQSDNTGNTIVNSSTVGILLDGAHETLVLGNHIGVHPDGTPMGNATAIRLDSGAVGNRIGYAADDTIDSGTWQPGADSGNVIAHNGAGISFELGANIGSIGNVLRGNRIHANGTATTPGIDLGMTALDVGGSGTGPNTLLNYPDFDPNATSWDQATGELEYRYRVQTVPTNADYPLTIDLYLADGNRPQGLTYIGSETYPESASFEFRTGSLTLTQPVDSSTHLVATATDASGSTSQFTHQPIPLIVSDALFSDRFEEP
ncbi:right-handed parallel beta-helix repeat-containing protein [Wenzhouxiangella sp. EGI_FJ10305]|uniref:right-handed parallel beta-helix repeat-containing protein n=1 Tax=Wenzhouxiangella sp. EGI_FJ10305 TaxID=3243768 RepID=UPI0035DA32D1